MCWVLVLWCGFGVHALMHLQPFELQAAQLSHLAGNGLGGGGVGGGRRMRRCLQDPPPPPPPPPLPTKQMWPLPPKAMPMGGFGGRGPRPGPGRQGGLHSLAVHRAPALPAPKGLAKAKAKGLAKAKAKGLAKAKATGLAKAKARGGKQEGDGPGDLAKGKNLAKGRDRWRWLSLEL